MSKKNWLVIVNDCKYISGSIIIMSKIEQLLQIKPTEFS